MFAILSVQQAITAGVNTTKEINRRLLTLRTTYILATSYLEVLRLLLYTNPPLKKRRHSLVTSVLFQPFRLHYESAN